VGFDPYATASTHFSLAACKAFLFASTAVLLSKHDHTDCAKARTFLGQYQIETVSA
jgi:hypothetical protein